MTSMGVSSCMLWCSNRRPVVLFVQLYNVSMLHVSHICAFRRSSIWWRVPRHTAPRHISSTSHRSRPGFGPRLGRVRLVWPESHWGGFPTAICRFFLISTIPPLYSGISFMYHRRFTTLGTQCIIKLERNCLTRARHFNLHESTPRLSFLFLQNTFQYFHLPLVFPGDLFPSLLPTKAVLCIFLVPHLCHVVDTIKSCVVQSWLDLFNNDLLLLLLLCFLMLLCILYVVGAVYVIGLQAVASARIKLEWNCYYYYYYYYYHRHHHHHHHRLLYPFYEIGWSWNIWALCLSCRKCVE